MKGVEHNMRIFLSSPNFAQYGLTALNHACYNGHTDTGKMLLDHGAVIDHCEKVNDLRIIPHFGMRLGTPSILKCVWFRNETWFIYMYMIT